MFKLKEEQYYSGVYYSFTKRGGLIAFLSKPVASEPTEGWLHTDLTYLENIFKDDHKIAPRVYKEDPP